MEATFPVPYHLLKRLEFQLCWSQSRLALSYLIFKTMVAIAIFAKGTSVRSYNALTFSPRI